MCLDNKKKVFSNSQEIKNNVNFELHHVIKDVSFKAVYSPLFVNIINTCIYIDVHDICVGVQF